MTDPGLQFLVVGDGASQRRIATRVAPGRSGAGPGLVWLPGFRSEMTSTKAAALAQFAAETGCALTRFDYSGHGQSPGDVMDGTIGHWLEEAMAVVAGLTDGPQILVGSSMGGYIALLVLRQFMRDDPATAARIEALVLIAPAWDMTEQLMWARFTAGMRRDIEEKGVYLRPSSYGDGPYPITRTLIEEGRRHLIGSEAFDPGRPVRILHGLQDPDVPWEHSLDLVAHLSGDWCEVEAVPDGDHRLSRPQDIAMLFRVIASLSGASP